MSLTPAVSIEGITKIFNPRSKFPVHALKGISFDFQEGNIIGLIGPNGAGKTTILRILLGFLNPTKGVVKVFGKSPDDLSVRKQIGYQADNHFVAKTISLAAYLTLHSELAGLGKNHDQINKLLDFFKLTGSARKPLSSLSKGMRQKAELVQAFLGEPKFIFLDEPTAALDPPSVFDLRDYLIQKKSEGVSILFSSHNLSEVEKICDRTLFINNGELQGDFTQNQIDEGFLEKAFRNPNQTTESI